MRDISVVHDTRLTKEQEAFCRSFAVCFDRDEAAKLVGITPRQAIRLLRHPLVQKRINELNNLHTNLRHIDKQTLLAQYARLAMYNPKRAYDETGQQLPIHMIDDDTAMAIKSYQHDKITFFDRTKSLDALAKYIGMLPDTPAAVSVNVNGENLRIELEREESNRLTIESKDHEYT